MFQNWKIKIPVLLEISCWRLGWLLGERGETLEGRLLAKLGLALCAKQRLALLAKLGIGSLLRELGRICVGVETAWELDVEAELSRGPRLLSLRLWRIQLELFCCVGSYSDALQSKVRERERTRRFPPGMSRTQEQRIAWSACWTALPPLAPRWQLPRF